jgi:uncharacterized repeat protein (TIGR03803 family)
MKGLLKVLSVVLLVSLAAVSQAQVTYNSLKVVYGTALSALIQATDGNLYGTAQRGGNGNGSVFKITPDGTLTTIYSFCSVTNCADGVAPFDALVQGPDGNFYGNTNQGGAYNAGTIFKITPEGALTTLYSFCACGDGGYPQASLVTGPDGNFYGTTQNGGVANSMGTFFKVTPRGTLTALYSFNPTTDGFGVGELVFGPGGNFYGAMSNGGANNAGTVFEITPEGTFTTLYSFCALTNCTDGANPIAGLTLGADGNYYGTTGGGEGASVGTVFKLANGKLTTLYSFNPADYYVDGAEPQGQLVLGTDGNFYGTTYVGGENSAGIIFQITPEGELTPLHSFNFFAANPTTAMIQATNGSFFGTTGGSLQGQCEEESCSTIYELSVGLGPFVTPQINFGGPGANVVILGSNLEGSTNVFFGGVSAEFTVVSNTEIIAKVPWTATTDRIHVITPSGTLTSNTLFYVTP